MTPQEVIDRLTRPAVEVDKDFVIAAVQCARALRVAMKALEFYETQHSWPIHADVALQEIESVFNNGTAGDEG